MNDGSWLFGYRRLFIPLRREGKPSGDQSHLPALSLEEAGGEHEAITTPGRRRYT